jgi:pimeloyl-ACP methyl ester carboxylesterase
MPAGVRLPEAIVRTAEVSMHGHRIAYREAGEPGLPVLLLVHGITSSSATWDPVIPALAEHAHVIAPDLLAMETPTSHLATTRWVLLRAVFVTCSSAWATIGLRWSGTRSAAGWRCSLPISITSTVIGWSWSPVGDWDARSALR